MRKEREKKERKKIKIITLLRLRIIMNKEKKDNFAHDQNYC